MFTVACAGNLVAPCATPEVVMQRLVRSSALVGALAISTTAAADIGSRETARLAAAATVVQAVHAIVPPDQWDRARCVAVIPELKRVAFVAGGEAGRGVMSCRAGDRWSAPVFLQL